MKNAPRKPMVSAIIAILVLISPIYAESASNLEKYLDCSSEKKIDIVFVFDTTNSMGGEISELRATANKFATDLEASNIDYQLGLVEFRDFPETCDGFSCGSPGDFAYSVKGNGTLTSEISTFSSWLKELKAGGGGSPGPEAVLAALRHAGSDLSWRNDAEKAIIVLTDAGAHPDGSCCNAEGDTLEGTIFELVDIGARAYIIGPEEASLKNIAENTGGQFYEIRSGLSLKPLLEEITKSLGCSFKTDVATACENNQLEVSVQLIGKDTIPYISGQTEAWMYLDQAGSISRINLRYDQEAEAYLGRVPDVCGSVELTVYGRAGERSAVQTVQVECGACGTEAAEELGTLSISGWAYDDSNGDGIKGADEAGLEGWAILLLKPDGSSIAQESDKNGYYIFTGLLPGSYKVVANAQEDWTATAPETGAKDVELVDVHESEIDFGFKLPSANQQSSQAHAESWPKTFGGSGADYGDSVRQTTDGGYIIAGSTSSYGVGEDDIWLIKTDASGNKLWDKIMGGAERDWPEAPVRQTTDGGYIIAGFTNSYGHDGAWLIKTDANGNKLWDKSFDGSRAYAVQETSDGGYIIAGDDNGTWLIKTDANGNKLWDKSFGGLGASAAQETSDGGYIIAASTESIWQTPENGDGTIYDLWLIKTDANGNKLWDKTFGGGPEDYHQVPVRDSSSDGWGYKEQYDGPYDLDAQSMQQTSDGGYIIAGARSSRETFLIKTDSDGNKQWEETFRRVTEDIVHSVQQTNEGGFILAGTTRDIVNAHVAYGRDAWLIKTDSKGRMEWDRIFGGSESEIPAPPNVYGENASWDVSDVSIRDETAMDVQQISDGGYIIVGSTESYGAGSSDVWLIRTDANGDIA